MSARAYGLVVLSLLAAPAGAATLCVNPLGTSGCQSSIAAAVGLAAAGDLIKVQAGTYLEDNILIAGKPGLQIQGANKLTTIIDPDVPGTAFALGVSGSDGVQIKNLTIRNGRGPFSIGVAGSNNVVLQGLRIVGARGVPGPAYAGSAIVIGNATTGHQVVGNEIRSCRFGVYFLTGPTNSIIKGNTIVGASAAGILVAGPSATNANNQILSNKISNTPIGIEAIGDTNTVSSNSVENAQTLGLVAVGLNPVVQSNKLTSAGFILASCTTCTGGSIKSNTSLGSLQGIAIEAAADAAGFVVQSNKMSQVTGYGLALLGNTVQAIQNGVTDTAPGGALSPGTLLGAGSCFLASGAGHTFSKNIATRCGAAGFYANGDAMTLTGNNAAGAANFGFVMDGNSGGPPYTNATFLANKALAGVGQGFAVINGATASTLTGNSSAKSRLDYCGVGAPLAGNTFPVQSPTCDILQ